MNADVKEKWLAALKSGDYRHSKERLKNINYGVTHVDGGEEVIPVAYCCLGVLCDIYPNIGTWDHADYLIYGPGGELKYSMDTSLPHELLSIAELDNIDEEKLININDDIDTDSFELVIKYIEENL